MKCSTEIKNRIKRTQGQINGVLNMMEQEKSCEEIVIQLKAIKSAIEKTMALMTTTNLIQAIEANHNIAIDNMDEAINLIVKNI